MTRIIVTEVFENFTSQKACFGFDYFDRLTVNVRRCRLRRCLRASEQEPGSQSPKRAVKPFAQLKESSRTGSRRKVKSTVRIVSGDLPGAAFDN
jgi:hypothetical protein